MRRIREATVRGFSNLSNAIRLQPDYHSEISDEYLAELHRHIDSTKPENFKLTPVSESGW